MSYSRQEQAILVAFGKRIRTARESLGWSQEDLAHEAGLDRTYVGGIERGERNVAILSLNKLAVALGEGFEDFFPCYTGRKSR